MIILWSKYFCLILLQHSVFWAIQCKLAEVNVSQTGAGINGTFSSRTWPSTFPQKITFPWDYIPITFLGLDISLPSFGLLSTLQMYIQPHRKFTENCPAKKVIFSQSSQIREFGGCASSIGRVWGFAPSRWGTKPFGVHHCDAGCAKLINNFQELDRLLCGLYQYGSCTFLLAFKLRL